MSLNQGYTGNLIGAKALLGTFTYICRQRPSFISIGGRVELQQHYTTAFNIEQLSTAYHHRTECNVFCNPFWPENILLPNYFEKANFLALEYKLLLILSRYY